MILLIVIAIAVLILCIFFTDTISEVLFTICIGLIFGVMIAGSLEKAYDKTDSLKEEKNSLIAEYTSYIDKSEIIKRMETHNQSCDEAEINANNVWRNPEALLREYNFSDFKIDIENLKD